MAFMTVCRLEEAYTDARRALPAPAAPAASSAPPVPERVSLMEQTAENTRKKEEAAAARAPPAPGTPWLQPMMCLVVALLLLVVVLLAYLISLHAQWMREMRWRWGMMGMGGGMAWRGSR